MKIKNLLKYLYFKYKYGKKLKIGYNVDLSKNAIFEGNNTINDNTFFSGKLGFSSYIGPNSHINGYVGRYCSIGANVNIVIGNHPIDYVSTSPVFYSLGKQCPYNFSDKEKYNEFNYADIEKRIHVIIGNDVWICSNVLIIGGIKIGNGAIIGAGAVVTKNVEPYSIVCGVPAIEIKKRFTNEYISFLENFKWWDKNEKWIRDNSDLFTKPDDFFKKFMKED